MGKKTVATQDLSRLAPHLNQETMLLRSGNKGPPNFAQWGVASSAAISAALRTHNSTPMGKFAEGSFGSTAVHPVSCGDRQ